ncbi:MAG: hypothetical protein COA78_06785 [Blastopirellula sp.]|nr:MAG: hypothetical protein COA78_06785 [Blastopirellula sp.]
MKAHIEIEPEVEYDYIPRVEATREDDSQPAELEITSIKLGIFDIFGAMSAGQLEQIAEQCLNEVAMDNDV